MKDEFSRAASEPDGPDINHLHHRLTDTPKAWQDQTVPAYFYPMLHDVVFRHCPHVKAHDLVEFQKPLQQRNWYRISLLILFFISDDCFAQYTLSLKDVIALLHQTAKELSDAGSNRVYINDVDRREEFIRVVLHSLNLRPKGETPTQAEDRLQAASSTERFKVLQASKSAEERARKLRVALAKQKAKEAADKMTRE